MGGVIGCPLRSRRHYTYASRAACSTSPAARGEVGFRAELLRSDGIRVRGPLRESEPVQTPPHPTCFAQRRSQVDLSPHAGRGGARGAASPILHAPRGGGLARPRAPLFGEGLGAAQRPGGGGVGR